MELKGYQRATLEILREYFEAATVSGPKQAYEAITNRPNLKERLRGFAGDYTPLSGIPDTPYVCLRLPTGGGKTILATHAIEVARKRWLEKEYPLVLWLTPTNTIRQQTVEALKNTRHPYRKALDEQFGGAVRIFDIEDFTQILPHDLATKCCIVVSTIQTLRVKDTSARKVYAHHEMLEPHFSNIPKNAQGLEPISETNAAPRYSFANLMHIHRPLMIVDEAHNAVTGLSEETQARVNPAAIIEFTATPRTRSNILYNVTAQELKDAEMIKLPVRLAEHGNWQEAVFGAVQNRANLAEAAAKDKNYIRPIVLFQAQNKNQEVTVEKLKQHLIEDRNIDPVEIAIVTGDKKDLDGMDLMQPDSKVNYIITVQALKEGWDCPFAYVFCSVANVSSAQDVEQLLGRVLRMPYAKRRNDPELNRAYANVTSSNFAEAANALRDRLVSLGFTNEEAEENIEPQRDLDEGMFGARARLNPKRSITLNTRISDADAKAISEVAPGMVKVRTDEAGNSVVDIENVPSAEQIEAMTKALPKAAASGFSEEAKIFASENAHLASPAAQGRRFIVPALMAHIQGVLEFLDPATYVDFAELRLSKLPARLDASEFAIRATADVFEIDLNGDRLTYNPVSRERQHSMDDIEIDGLSHEQLVGWLARNLRDPQFGYGELVGWLSSAVSFLTKERSLSLTALNRCMFPLLRVLERKIADFKRGQIEGVYQRALFADEAKPEASLDQGFEFKRGLFADVRLYAGDYTFQRHFFGPHEVPAFDGKKDGEEFRCAQALDSLDSVRYWVRNVARHREAFRLPLKDGWFYPDFVAELVDGRTAVIEYKGEAYATNDDSREKRAVGRVWQFASSGKGVFVFVEKEKDGENMRSQMETAFGS